MNHLLNVTKKKNSALALILLGGCLVSFNTYAAHTGIHYTDTYNMGTLGISPYINSPTVYGAFNDRYNFSVASSANTASTAVTIDLDLGDFGFHISGLDLDLFSASGTWLDGDMVTGSSDVAVSVTELLGVGNYYFRVRGTGDGDLTNKGIYTFSAAASFAAPVPEMDTYAMMVAGLGLIGFVVSRRRLA